MMTTEFYVNVGIPGWSLAHPLGKWVTDSECKPTGKWRMWDNGYIEFEVEFKGWAVEKRKSFFGLFTSYDHVKKKKTEWITEKEVRWYNEYNCGDESKVDTETLILQSIRNGVAREIASNS
jgi:hypothetical protein